MDEYIKREALRDALYDADAITMNGVKILNQFPAADVVPVKWLPIPNFEGLYEINTLSQIRNSSGEILKQQIRREKYTCYKVVSLWKDGRYYKKGVHRLMAETFLPNPDCLPVVNHKDEDGTNNLLSNLEWCSKSYNASYGTAPKKISRATKGKESEKRKPVLCYGMDGSFMSWYPSVTAAAKDVKGKYKQYFGCLQRRAKNSLWICLGL